MTKRFTYGAALAGARWRELMRELEARLHAWADVRDGKRGAVYVVVGWRRKQARLLTAQWVDITPVKRTWGDGLYPSNNLWAKACELGMEAVDAAYDLLSEDSDEYDEYDGKIQTEIFMNMPEPDYRGAHEADPISCAEMNACANTCTQKVTLYPLEDGRRIFAHPGNLPLPTQDVPLTRELAKLLLRRA